MNDTADYDRALAVADQLNDAVRRGEPAPELIAELETFVRTTDLVAHPWLLQIAARVRDAQAGATAWLKEHAPQLEDLARADRMRRAYEPQRTA